MLLNIIGIIIIALLLYRIIFVYLRTGRISIYEKEKYTSLKIVKCEHRSFREGDLYDRFICTHSLWRECIIVKRCSQKNCPVFR